MATVPTVLGHSRQSNSRSQVFPHSRIQVRKDLMVEEGTIPSEEVSLPKDSLARKVNKVDFFLFKIGSDLLQPLEFVPTSRERVVPIEWQVRSVLGGWKSKAKVISTQASQYRQLCADQWLPGSCKFEHTKGSNTGHELDQGPTWRVETLEPSAGHYYRPGKTQLSR